MAGPVAAAIPLAGKLMPFLAKAGSAKMLPVVLRSAGALGGAAPGLMKGDLGAALLGGGLGAASTLGLGGLAGKGAAGLSGLTMKGLGKFGLSTIPGVASAVPAIAGAAVPALGGLAVGRLGGGIGSGPTKAAGGGLAQGGAGIIGYNSVTGEPIVGAGVAGSALPPGMGQFGGINPYGSPLDVLNPAGLDAGRRLRMQKDAEAQRDAMNVLLPTLRKFSEQAKKDEFARSMAGKGISQNILTNAALTQAAQQAGLQMGTTAAQQAGSALTQRYTY